MQAVEDAVAVFLCICEMLSLEIPECAVKLKRHIYKLADKSHDTDHSKKGAGPAVNLAFKRIGLLMTGSKQE